MFFCFGAIAWLIRVLLLAMVKPLALLNLRRTSSSYGANWVGTGRSSSQQQQYSPFRTNSPSSTAATQRQQLPGCARVVPHSPGRQSPGDGRVSNVVRVYGTPVTYADAVTHGEYVDATQGFVGEGVAAGGVLKSPRRGGGQAGGNGSGSATGRVRFADDVL